MNTNESTKTSLALYGIAIFGSFLILAGLVWEMRRASAPAPLGQDRIKERKKNLAEIRAAEAEGLSTYAWVDKGKGIARLPIARALEITLQEYQNPSAARSNRIARAEKAAAAAPKAPEKPNQYE